MFDSLYTQIGMAVTFLIVAFAFWKGDEAERTGAGCYVLAWMATLLTLNNASFIQSAVQRWALLAIDTTMLLALIAIAWRYRRSWSIWAAAIQALLLMAWGMSHLDYKPTQMAFYLVASLAGYGVLACIGIGTFWAWQERRAAANE